MKALGELLEVVAPATPCGGAGAAVKGIACASRKVQPGGVFVALPGQQCDGNLFVAQALARGAVVVISESVSPPAAPTAPYVVAPSALPACSLT